MDILNVTSKELINLDLKAKTKDEALRELCQLLYEQGSISDIEAFLKDVYLREEEGQTGLGSHIAIPHGKSDAVTKTSFAVGRTKEPIEWESLDGKPVYCIILFAVRTVDQTTEHLKILAQIATALADDEVLEKMLASNEPEEVMNLLANN